MEKEKNNAVEKVENLTDSNSDNNKKSVNRSINDTNTTENTNTSNQQKKKMDKEKADKEKRVNDAKLQQKQRAEKSKKKREAVAARERAKKAKREVIRKRREEYKTEKLRRKEERLARRDMLKHESREERQNRIAAENQAKINAREAKRFGEIRMREQKAAERKQREADRRALKEQKRRYHAENRKEKRGRGIGGWLAAVIALGTTTLVFATLFTLGLVDNIDLSFMGGKNLQGTTVQESYYDLVDYIGNMDVNLSKILISNDSSQQQKLLSELSTQASLAAADITRLPLKDESKYYTTKYVNQVADYSKYLNSRLIDGFSLTEGDKENLTSIYRINNTLKAELSVLNSEMGNDFDFRTIFDDSSDNVFLGKFNELESRAVDYPKLIYDGPFSDSLNEKTPSGLSGNDITTRQAEERFKEIFSIYNIEKAETVGESNSIIPTYSISGMSGKNEVYAQISKKGGHLIMFNYYSDCVTNNYSLAACEEIADRFIESLGIDNMSAVWATENGTTAYINYCYNQGGTVVYPDMIKVTVCKERGIVSAFDGNAYYLNHKQREINNPLISQRQAITGLSTDLSIENVRLAIVPKGESKEVLAYEVYGKSNGADYYIYVDATTGKEVQIFRVVETTEGTLLI